MYSFSASQFYIWDGSMSVLCMRGGSMCQFYAWEMAACVSSMHERWQHVSVPCIRGSSMSISCMYSYINGYIKWSLVEYIPHNILQCFYNSKTNMLAMTSQCHRITYSSWQCFVNITNCTIQVGHYLVFSFHHHWQSLAFH